MGQWVVDESAMLELIDLDEELQQVGTGFTFTEGPVWHPNEGFLLFSDMPADIRRKYIPGVGIEEVCNPSNKCNGMTYDAGLNLLVCEHATSSLKRERRDGTIEVVASHFEGKELNSPNDVCVRSDGWIFFTDPWFGRMPVFGVERERELGFQGVYRVSPDRDGDVELVVDRDAFVQPNGLCFSPDESLMYINDTPRTLIDVYDVDKDGTLSNGRRFAEGIGSGAVEEGKPDGMKCDERGNVWVTGPGGVWIFDPEGTRLGLLRVPEKVANFTWGESDWHTLYLTASTSLYAVRTKVGPRKEPYMTSARLE